MSRTQLPAWRSVLAVVAHPDDESFGLGSVLAAFADAGARVSVLCFTRGEASGLHGVEGDLATLRAEELASAASALGLDDVTLLAYPDGRLPDVDVHELAAQVVAVATEVDADGLVGFDRTGVTGHPDHAHATAAALDGAATLDLPVLGWVVPDWVAQALNTEYDASFDGLAEDELDLTITVDRERQRRAVSCHPSQAVPGSVMWRRIELLEDKEYLRWLRSPEGT